MNKETDFLEEVKSSLRETVRDITSEDIHPGAEVHHFKKAKNVINLIIWEAGDKLETIRKRLKEKKFEAEIDGIHFPFIPVRTNEISEEEIRDVEKAVGIVLIGMDFMKKEINKTIDFFEFYKNQMWATEPEEKKHVAVAENTE